VKLAAVLTLAACHPAGARVCDHNTVTSHCTTPTPDTSP